MTGKTHVLGGIALGVGVTYMFTQDVSLGLIGGAALGSLLPDIDHPESKISRANPVTWLFAILYRFVLDLVSIIFKILITPLGWCGVKIPPLSSGHRGPLTHGGLGIILFTLLLSPLLSWTPTIFYGLMIGVLSHIFLDMLNPQGVPLMWPLWKKNIRFLPRFMAPTTSHLGERIVVFGLLAITLALSLATMNDVFGLF